MNEIPFKNKLKALFFTQNALFYFILIINVILLFTVRFYPSMDGPSHLYNSNLLIELLSGGSPELHNYFNLNDFPVANWIGMAILALFNSFLPAWMADKILILIYLTGISLSFRYLIKQTNPENSGLSFLIFPFAYTFLFHLGFYNFSLSFVFLFLITGFWIQHKHDKSYKHYLVLFVLLALLYFSALLTFVFAGICLGLLSITSYIFGLREKTSRFGKLLKELLLLLLIAMPFLVLIFLFYKNTTFYPAGQQYPFDELVKWLNDVRCLIVYDYVGDARLTQQILHIIIAIIAISLYFRLSREGKKILSTDVLLIPIFIALGLFFKVSNSSGAGMMTDRYCLLFYMLFIIWVASQPLPKKAVPVFIVLIIGFHLGLLFKHHNGAIRDLDNRAQTIANAQNYIDKNSVVLPVNLSENWIQPHFSNYLGVDKPMIILENYEASVGWFPLQWKMDALPDIRLGELQKTDRLNWPTNLNAKNIRQVDYVFLYGNVAVLKDSSWMQLDTILQKTFRLEYASDDKYVNLFRRNQ